VIAREFGSAIEELASRHELAGSIDAARQLRGAVAQMRESARLRNLAQAGEGSVGGTSEPEVRAAGSSSESPPWSHLTVGEVAERLGFRTAT